MKGAIFGNSDYNKNHLNKMAAPVQMRELRLNKPQPTRSDIERLELDLVISQRINLSVQKTIC